MSVCFNKYACINNIGKYVYDGKKNNFILNEGSYRGAAPGPRSYLGPHTGI